MFTLGYTAVAAAHGGIGGGGVGGGGAFNWTGFLGRASVAVIWQLSYAPYVSDYSRYLPSSTTPRSAFWYTYFVTILGAGMGSDAQLAILSRIMPGPLFVFVMLVFFFGVVDAGVINMYGSSPARRDAAFTRCRECTVVRVA